jgi:putative exosortase-associated protein (TIGR04073 family)
MKKGIAICFAAAMIFSTLALPKAFAEGTAGDYGAGMGTKFGRGLWNVVSSPAEIPCTMNQDMRTMNPAAGFFTGFGKGTVFMLRRMLVGVSEFAVFYMSPFEATLPPVCSAE